MSDFFLTQVINFGTPLVGLILFLGALGFPVGASVVVIAAGAFGQQGILDIPSAAIYGLLGAVIGDTLSFGMGYYAKDAVQRRFGNSAAWQGATETFQKNAGPQQARGEQREQGAQDRHRPRSQAMPEAGLWRGPFSPGHLRWGGQHGWP